MSVRRVHGGLIPALFVLGVSTCTRHDVSLGDGSSLATAVSDGSAPRFSTPVVLDTISSSDTTDDDPSLTSDETLLYFDSKRDGGLGEEDIWMSERATPDVPFGEPEHVDGLNTKSRETGIALALDGLTVWFSSDRPESSGGLDVFVATRASRADAWSSVRAVDELNTPDDDLVSAVDATGTILMLGRRKLGDDNYDIFESDRVDTSSPWGSPRALSELDTSASESDAFLVESGTALLFTRKSDLYVATRPGTTGAFGDVTALKDLNTSKDERDPWASADLGHVVFSSNRSGSYSLYEAFEVGR